ncbi:MAG: hypothetical protein PWP55_1238, partial [Clostridiales bacterium]|nr:hypothetical protein [Clostridiales bacterium]
MADKRRNLIRNIVTLAAIYAI